MRLTRLLLISFACASLTCCSSTKPGDPKELTDPSQKDAIAISLDTPEATLLENAKRYYDSGLFSLAKENFAALHAGYPNSPWSEFAQIKVADCLFESGEYPDAAKAYEEYVKNRPTAEPAPYMLFRAARSSQLAQKGVGRDPAPLNKALELYSQLITDYPDSEYIESAKKYRSEVVDNLLASEERVKHFYEKQDRIPAVIAREKMIKERWIPVVNQTRYAEEKKVEEVPEGAVLSAAPAAVLEKAEKVNPKTSGETVNQVGRIVKIECSNSETRGVFLYFDQDLSLLDAYKRPQRVISQNGFITLTLPGIIAPDQTSDCFGQKDLTLHADGVLSVQSGEDGTARSLSDPARLFIAIPKS